MINFQSEHNYTQLEFGDLLRAKNDLHVKMKLATINCFLDDIWKVTTPLHNNKKINLDIFYSFCFKWKALFCAYWGRVCFHFVSNLGLDKFFGHLIFHLIIVAQVFLFGFGEFLSSLSFEIH